MRESTSYYIEYLLITIAFAGVFFPVIPVFYIAILYFVMMLFRLNLTEIVYMCNMALSSVLGTLFYNSGIGGIGGFMYLLGFALFAIGLIKKDIKYKNFIYALLPLFVIIFYLFISVETSTGGSVAQSKLVHSLVIGFVSVIAFGVLFNNIEKVRTTLLSLYLLIAAILTLAIAIKVNGINGPNSLFDIGFLRFQTSINDIYGNIENFRISYHLPGSIVLQSLGVFFLRDKYCKKTFLVLFVVLCSLPILYSGARQSIVVFLLMLFFGWRQNEQKCTRSSVNRFFSTGMIVLFIVIIVAALIGNIFASITEYGLSQGSGRENDFIRAIENFKSNPLFGIGFGRDHVFDNYDQYAHNIVLELLGELGLVGFVLFFFILWHYFKKCKISINSWLIFFLAFIGPALFSNGFDINIKVFTFFFAGPYLLAQKYRMRNILY